MKELSAALQRARNAITELTHKIAIVNDGAYVPGEYEIAQAAGKALRDADDKIRELIQECLKEQEGSKRELGIQ